MNGSKEYILSKFDQHLQESFEAHCEEHGLKSDPTQFISYLVDQDIIPQTHIERYALKKELEKISTVEKCTKTMIVSILASRFAVSERTVWSVLKNSKSKKLEVRQSVADCTKKTTASKSRPGGLPNEES